MWLGFNSIPSPGTSIYSSYGYIYIYIFFFLKKTKKNGPSELGSTPMTQIFQAPSKGIQVKIFTSAFNDTQCKWPGR